MKRGLKLFSVATVAALLGILFMPGAAFAVTTCTVVGDTVTVQLDVDSTTALRLTAANGHIEFVEGAQAAQNPVPTAAFAIIGGACSTAGADRVVINGTSNGQETLRLIDNGFWEASSFVTFVDLGAGNDTFDFTRDSTGGTLDVAVRPATTGQTVVDLDPSTNSDLQLNNTENLRATGLATGGGTDVVFLGPDFFQGTGFDNSLGAQAPRTEGAYTIPGTTATATLNLPFSFDGGDVADLFIAGNANDVYNGQAGPDILDYSNAPSAVNVDLQAGTATGGSGNDTLIDIQSVIGSDFNDNLLGSSINNNAAPVVPFFGLMGGFGDDFIDGRAGDDILDGGPDNDTIYEGTAANGADTITGGADTGVAVIGEGDNITHGDTIDYGDRATDLSLDATGAPSGAGGCPSAATCEGDSITGVETFIAGSGNDTFTGAGVDEVFIGNAGNDSFSGAGGFDYLSFENAAAGVTVDVPAGTATGQGNDTFDTTIEAFVGSSNADTFIDKTSGANSDNTYLGRGGNDVFDQGASLASGPIADDDVIDCGPGSDLLDYGDRTRDVALSMLSAASGNGESAENDALFGTALGFSDDCENATTGSGNDAVIGNFLNNTITSGNGNDSVAGGDGNDTFNEGAAANGSDTINGDNGADSVDYSQRTNDLRLTLGGGGNQGEAGEGDTLNNMENAFAGSGNDLLIGNAADNILRGGAGDDLINGNFGQDQLEGADGTDTVSYATGTAVVLDLAAGTAVEQGSGTATGGFDTVTGFELAVGTPGNDILNGDSGPNTLKGLAGNDTIRGKGGDDTLNGNQGRDTVQGGSGNDAVKGGAGNDDLRGGSGDDALRGGPGRDRCRGGPGADDIRGCER